MKALRFTSDDVDAANDEWGFNCGPAAICAVLDLTPAELKPRMAGFIEKGYTNPTLMLDILALLRTNVRRMHWRGITGLMPELNNGLVRIQWAGPWTNPGVPAKAAYRKTHWVGVRGEGAEVFDINAMSEGGWISGTVWKEQLAPWIIAHCVPKGDGRWWAANVLEVARR